MYVRKRIVKKRRAERKRERDRRDASGLLLERFVDYFSLLSNLRIKKSVLSEEEVG